MQRVLVTTFLVLTFSSAQAFEVILDGSGTNATGITGLEINPGSGELWDIAFEVDSSHTSAESQDIFGNPSNQTGAENAAAIINAALFGAEQGLGGPRLTVGSQSDTYFVPYLYNDPGCAQPGSGTCVSFADGFFSWAAPVTDAEIGLTSNVDVAKFTPHVVPVPPAVWLFGSALGMLGWVRHRSRRQRTT